MSLVTIVLNPTYKYAICNNIAISKSICPIIPGRSLRQDIIRPWESADVNEIKERRKIQMSDFQTINNALEIFAKRIPEKGMYISYLTKARELMELYDEALASAEDKTAVKEIAKAIRESVMEARDAQTKCSVDETESDLVVCAILEIEETLKDMVKCIWLEENPVTEEGFIKEFVDAFGDPVEENCEDRFNREHADYMKQRSIILDETYEVTGENFQELIDANSLAEYIVGKFAGTIMANVEHVYGDDEQSIAHYYFHDRDGNKYEYYEKTVWISDPHIDDEMIEAWFKMNDKFIVEPTDESLIWDII